MRRPIPFVVLVALVACSGGGNGGQSPVPLAPESQSVRPSVVAQSATPMPTIFIEPGRVNGLANQFTPKRGDTGTGGQSQTIDGFTCAPTMVENKYHVHFFLGFMVNGKEIAIPDSTGMYLPGTPSNGYTNTAKCFYPIHTHDASGLVHIESASTASLGTSITKLGQYLDVWGMHFTKTGFGPFNGPVHIFYARTPLGTLTSGPYAPYTASATGIALYSHEAIWIEIGSTYVPASQLPPIHFYTQY